MSFDFINEFIKINNELGFENVSSAIKQEVSTKLEKHVDKEALAEIDEELDSKKNLLNKLSDKYAA